MGDTGVDVLDAVDSKGPGSGGGIVDAAGGKQDDVAGLGQGVEALQRNEVDGGAILEHELEAVGAED